ncbi:hypothetical protein [Streptomyces violascens]|uniref:hypothetical protein n=1 Tax=Streptomyces violascens TaxID=67381 RepID=UPI0036B6F4B1
MPILHATWGQACEAGGNLAGMVADVASQAESAAHEALGRALTALASEGPVACAQHAGAQAASWLTALPDRRIADLLPLPEAVSPLLPEHTVAALLRTVPVAAAQAAEAVRSGAASAEEAVHGAMSRTLTTLAYEGPAACARQTGNSLLEGAWWTAATLAQAPSAAGQGLLRAVPLPLWCTRLLLRWAASYVAAHIYGAARQAREIAGGIAGELCDEAVRMMETVSQELGRLCAPAPAAAAPAPELTPEQRRTAELRAFRASLLGLGLDEVEDLIAQLETGDPPDAERLTMAREFHTLQWAAASGGADAYLQSLEPERLRLQERIGILQHKREKTTPSRVLPYALLPDHYRDKHHQEEAELVAARGRLGEIETTRATVLRSRQEIADLQTLIEYVHGSTATRLAELTPSQLDRLSRLLQDAVNAADGFADTVRLREPLDRVRREPDARSMLNMVRARGVVGLYEQKDKADRAALVFDVQQGEYEPGWLEWAALSAPDAARAAQYERLKGQAAEAYAVSAEYAGLIALYESPEYAQRVARAEARLKTFRDHDFDLLLRQEYEAAADRVVAAAGNNVTLLRVVGVLLDRLRGGRPEGLGRVHIANLEGLAQRLPELVAAAGPLYLQRVDFSLLLREVEKELAARRASVEAA